jgi:hypothetical protein
MAARYHVGAKYDLAIGGSKASAESFIDDGRPFGEVVDPVAETGAF